MADLGCNQRWLRTDAMGARGRRTRPPACDRGYRIASPRGQVGSRARRDALGAPRIRRVELPVDSLGGRTLRTHGPVPTRPSSMPPASRCSPCGPGRPRAWSPSSGCLPWERLSSGSSRWFTSATQPTRQASSRRVGSDTRSVTSTGTSPSGCQLPGRRSTWQRALGSTRRSEHSGSPQPDSSSTSRYSGRAAPGCS